LSDSYLDGLLAEEARAAHGELVQNEALEVGVLSRGPLGEEGRRFEHGVFEVPLLGGLVGEPHVLAQAGNEVRVAAVLAKALHNTWKVLREWSNVS